MSIEKTVSVFMPAYNAADHIDAVIARMPADAWTYVRNVWIINDGSTDNTRERVEALGRKHACIRPNHFEQNRGYGHAVRTGLALCKDDGCAVAVCLHADGQYPPESIPAFVAAMRENRFDILQGSRIASGTALSGGMPLYKLVAGKTLTFFENLVFGLSMTDYHSGFLCYSRRALDAIPFDRLSASFDFDLEVIASARARGLVVSELPIPTRYAGEESHLNPVTYGMRVVGVMVRYMLGGYR